MDYEEKYLIMVTPNNNNKYYKMTVNGNGWTAEYGRVGATPQRKDYPFSKWSEKYNEKIKKGYVDQTDLKQELILKASQDDGVPYKEIKERAIQEIVERLRRMAREVVRANYRVTSDQVTQKMVDAAQRKLNDLTYCQNLDAFNDTLLELFTIIPRKMDSVAAFLAKSTADFNSIIDKEQSLLDTVQGQVREIPVVKPEHAAIGNGKQTILEELGLAMEPCTSDDIRIIKEELGANKGQFVNAWRVTNNATQKKFEQFMKKYDVKETKLLWHGSRNENWWNIIKTGLVLRPTNVVITGKMFGYGSYFANLAQKSIGYTSLRGAYWSRGDSNRAFLALMEVAYGKPYDVECSCDMNWNILHKKGYHSLHAHAGRSLYNDEIVVYREDQMTIRYLVEIKAA